MDLLATKICLVRNDRTFRILLRNDFITNDYRCQKRFSIHFNRFTFMLSTSTLLFYIALLYLVRLSVLIPIPCSGSVDRDKSPLPVLQAMTIISDPESVLAVTSHSLSMIDVSARLHRE